MESADIQLRRPMLDTQSSTSEWPPVLDEDTTPFNVYVRPVVMEFTMTALFVFLGCGSVLASTVISPATPLVTISLCFGISLVVLVYASASVSGGHINPVVTMAMMICGYCPILKGFAIMAAQMIGGVVGAALLKGVYPESSQGRLGLTQLGAGVSIGNGILMESILTFVLVFTILRTDKDGKAVGNAAPLAIGFAVLVDHLAGLPITGASMNPARSFGPAVMVPDFDSFYVYCVGPIIGALAACALYYPLYRNEKLQRDHPLNKML